MNNCLIREISKVSDLRNFMRKIPSPEEGISKALLVEMGETVSPEHNPASFSEDVLPEARLSTRHREAPSNSLADAVVPVDYPYANVCSRSFSMVWEFLPVESLLDTRVPSVPYVILKGNLSNVVLLKVCSLASCQLVSLLSLDLQTLKGHVKLVCLIKRVRKGNTPNFLPIFQWVLPFRVGVSSHTCANALGHGNENIKRNVHTDWGQGASKKLSVW